MFLYMFMHGSCVECSVVLFRTECLDSIDLRGVLWCRVGVNCHGGRRGGARGPRDLAFAHVSVRVCARVLREILVGLVPHRMLELN